MTGERPEDLHRIVQDIEDEVRAARDNTCRYLPEQERARRRTALSPRNRVLMVMIWLRKYGTHTDLSALFGVGVTTVNSDIRHIIPILRAYLEDHLKLPSMVEFDDLRGAWPSFPNAVAAVDATIHRCWRPLINQGQYYRGDKACHFMLTQGTVDPAGYFIDVEAGFRGGMNDTGIFNISRLGRGDIVLPAWAVVLANGGYPNRAPLLRPYTDAQAAGNPQLLEINEAQRACRSEVERAFRRLKVYRVGSRVWAGRKAFLAVVIEVATCLTNKNHRRNRVLRGIE